MYEIIKLQRMDQVIFLSRNKLWMSYITHQSTYMFQLQHLFWYCSTNSNFDEFSNLLKTTSQLNNIRQLTNALLCFSVSQNNSIRLEKCFGYKLLDNLRYNSDLCKYLEFLPSLYVHWSIAVSTLARASLAV